jgi:hypothetical protein
MEFRPIILRYEGLEADRHLIDLGQVGLSIHGAAQLLGSAGTVVLTGHYARRAPALSVKALRSAANALSTAPFPNWPRFDPRC